MHKLGIFDVQFHIKCAVVMISCSFRQKYGQF